MNDLIIPTQMPPDLAQAVTALAADYSASGGYHPMAATWAARLRETQVLTKHRPDLAVKWVSKLLSVLPPRAGMDMDLLLTLLPAVCGEYPAIIWSDANLVAVAGKLKFPPSPAEFREIMEPFALRAQRVMRLLDILAVKPAEAAPIAYEIPPAPPPRAMRAPAGPEEPGDTREAPVSLSGKPLHGPVRTVEEQIRILNGGVA